MRTIIAAPDGDRGAGTGDRTHAQDGRDDGIAGLPAVALGAGEDDPYLWLEEIGGKKAIAWVKAQNQRTLAEFGKRRSTAGCPSAGDPGRQGTHPVPGFPRHGLQLLTDEVHEADPAAHEPGVVPHAAPDWETV